MRHNWQGTIALATVMTVACLLSFAVVADSPYKRTIGALTIAIANGLYCQLAGEAGCIMAGDIEGAVGFQDSNNVIQVKATDGDLEGEIVTSNTLSGLLIRNDAASGGVIGVEATIANIGSKAATDGGSYIAAISESYVDQSSRTIQWGVTGSAVMVPTPQTALAISGTPDVTRAPSAAGSSGRMAAASSGQSWTPAETNALDGAIVCLTNTGSNTITMAPSSGVYEGRGQVLAGTGNWGTVCMEYVTDRWVQRSIAHTGPYDQTTTSDFTNATTTFANVLTVALPIGTWRCNGAFAYSQSTAADAVKVTTTNSTYTSTQGSIGMRVEDSITALADMNSSTSNNDSVGTVTLTDSTLGTWEGWMTVTVSVAGNFTIDAANEAATTGTLTVFKGATVQCYAELSQ